MGHGPAVLTPAPLGEFASEFLPCATTPTSVFAGHASGGPVEMALGPLAVHLILNGASGRSGSPVYSARATLASDALTGESPLWRAGRTQVSGESPSTNKTKLP